jgi:hypothetical protein
LRSMISPVQDLIPGVDDNRTFAVAFVSLFMQVVGLLQLPVFLGPSFSPFVAFHNLINSPLNAALSNSGPATKYKTRELPAKAEEEESEGDIQLTKTGDNKSKPKRKKGKKQKKS